MMVVNMALRKKYRITITVDTPDISMTQKFVLADYDTAETWIQEAKDWISKEKKEG